MDAAILPRASPALPSVLKTANAEEEMRKNKIGVLALVLMLTMSVSCSRIGKPSDDAIATDIKARMFSEPALKAATVDVVSKQGEVTLTGQVPDDAARLAAYKIASETKGVSRVNDQMSVATAQISVPQAATPNASVSHAIRRSVRSPLSASAKSEYSRVATQPPYSRRDAEEFSPGRSPGTRVRNVQSPGGTVCTDHAVC